jgi:D-aminopeptidase
MSNGSGDFVIAFSTHPSQRRQAGARQHEGRLDLSNRAMTQLFQATVESVEEAVLNSLFMATTTTGPFGTVKELPIQRVLELMKKRQ